MKTIAVIGTLDTKGAEHAFLADRIRSLGCNALLIDVGTLSEPTVAPDIRREAILGANASYTDRGQAIGAISSCLPGFIRTLFDEGKIDGVISMGGTGGTAIGTAAMRALPLGVPKVMVSTVASGDVSRYVDISDILMFPSIVDVSGLNRISQGVFSRAAATIVAMVNANADSVCDDAKPLVVASMFGNTTKCVERAKQRLEEHGYEVLVFHATGVGGRTMEAIIESGVVAGVLDITTTEWADELVGGILRGGPHRLEAAARHGVPAIVTPGCLDMVNFGERASIPDKFKDRIFYQHNPQITLMRTTAEECEQLGAVIASKLNLSTGPVLFAFPRKAISMISAVGQPFHDALADEALLGSLRRHMRPDIQLHELNVEINDAVFADFCVDWLLGMMQSGR